MPQVRFPQTYVSFSASHSTAMTPHIAEGMKLPQEVLDMIIGHLLGCIDLLDVWKPQKGLFPVFLPKICFAGDKRWLRASIEHLLKNAIVQPRRDYDIEWFTYWLGSAGLRHVRKLGFPNFTRRTHDYEARKTTYEFPTNIELAMRCPNLEHLTITFYADHLFSRPIYDDTWEEPRKLSKVIEEFELHRLCHLPKLRYLRMLCMSTRWIEENSAGPWSALALLKGWFVEQFERKKVEVSAGLIYPRRLRRY